MVKMKCHYTIEPLQPFGGEVQGLQLKSLPDRDLQCLKKSIGECGFLVIRKQVIDDEVFCDFLERLGPPTFTEGEAAVEGFPQLNCVSNVGRTSPPKSVWHSDTSYVDQPPAFTALRPLKLPESGGQTLFSDQCAEYNALPQGVRQLLKNCQALHFATGVPQDKLSQSECWHPLFLRHPDSGRTALFLTTPRRIRGVSGYSENVSLRIVNLLYRHSTRARFVYHHDWCEGDIVIWDNRCTMHRTDHSAVQGDRVFHRGIVAGDQPLPAYAQGQHS